MTTTTPAQGRIVVGVHSSPHSIAALRWALRQAVLTVAQVEAISCWHAPSMVAAYVPAAYIDIDLTRPTSDIALDAVADAVAATPGADQLRPCVPTSHTQPACSSPSPSPSPSPSRSTEAVVRPPTRRTRDARARRAGARRGRGNSGRRSSGGLGARRDVGGDDAARDAPVRPRLVTVGGPAVP